MPRRAWIATAVLAAALLAATSPLGADYGNLGCHVSAPRCDEPAWPLEALARGDVSTFVHDQPLMGPASLVLRAPFAAATRLFRADLTWHYRAGLFACLLLLALLALELARRSRARGHGRIHTALLAALVFVNPLVISAIDAGHPEDLVAVVAVAGSALLVLDARWTRAALALGVAVATKAWVLLLVLPLLMTVPAPRRLRFALVAGAVVLALYAPLVAGDPHRFEAVVQSAGSLGERYGEATPPDAWFFATRRGDFVWPSGIHDGQVSYVDATGYNVSDQAAHLAHALVFVLALVLTLAWLRAGASARPESLFLLMSAILLLRCVLDPGDHLYYHAAAATTLLGYEALRPHARLPWLGAGFIGALWIVTRVNAHLETDTGFAWVYLAFAVPTLAGLALIACRRSRSTPPTRLSRISPRRVTAS